MVFSNKAFDITQEKGKDFSFQNIYYYSIRNEIITLLKKINSSFENSSATYYLSLYYADKTFNLPNFNEELKKYYKYEFKTKTLYTILSICCLIISTKFNENDPHFPGIYNFLKLCNKYTNYSNFIQIADLVEGEIFILKLLKYKLDYYSVYNFLVFFFGHGIILDNFSEKFENSKKLDTKQILEKIYILSREILDLLNNDNSKQSIELLCENNHKTAAIILRYSIEKIIDIKLDKDANEYNIIFEYYEIDIDNNFKEAFYNLINNIYIKRTNFSKNISKSKSNIGENSKKKSIKHIHSTSTANIKKNQFNNCLNINYNNGKGNNYTYDIIKKINYNKTPNFHYYIGKADYIKENKNDYYLHDNQHIKYENKKYI